MAHFVTWSVVIWLGSMPTLLKLPHHLQRRNHHRKPPAVRQISSAASVLDEQFERTPSTSTTEHPYFLASPRKLKRRLGDATDALEQSKKRLKISQQKTRRLAKKLNTMCDVIPRLKKERYVISRSSRKYFIIIFRTGIRVGYALFKEKFRPAGEILPIRTTRICADIAVSF